MLCVDVNVLIDAHRREQSRHEAVSARLETARTGREPLGVPSIAASDFVRIVTHPRIFREPTPTRIAIEFINALVDSPATMLVEPGERHFTIFTGMCRDLELRGNTVPDAYLAALALEQGATL